MRLLFEHPNVPVWLVLLPMLVEPLVVEIGWRYVLLGLLFEALIEWLSSRFIVHWLEGDEPCPFCCYSGGPIKNRFQAKKSFGITGESCCDSVMIAVCCPLCSEVQIATELDFQKNQRSKIHIK